MRIDYKAVVAIFAAQILPFSSAIGQSASPPVPDEVMELDSEPASATDRRPPCSKKLWAITDAAPYVGFSKLNGIPQTIEQLVLVHSQCFNPGSLNRWKIDASVAHVGGGGYRAESGSIGIGLELHPFGNKSGFSVTPVARVSYDNNYGINDRTAWGGEITAENIFQLNAVERPIEVIDAKGRRRTKSISVPGNQLILAARGAYRRENILGQRIQGTVNNKNQLTGYAMVGWDGHFRGGRTRWQTNLSYQSIDGGVIKGFGSATISLRNLDHDFQSYKRVYQIIGNFGSSGYRSIIFSIDFRFGKN
jgi:hypothetical protein